MIIPFKDFPLETRWDSTDSLINVVSLLQSRVPCSFDMLIYGYRCGSMIADIQTTAAQYQNGTFVDIRSLYIRQVVCKGC